MKKSSFTVAWLALLSGAASLASGQPAPTMYTLDQVYYYLADGTEAAWGAHSLEPRSGTPGGTVPGYSKDLGQIYDHIKAEFSRCDAGPADVEVGTRFFSTQTDNWGVQTGAAAYKTPLQTGQRGAYRIGDDGWYKKGVAFSYQTVDPAGNGEIVTIDNVTGLMWASDGSGKGCNWNNTTDWNSAIDWAESLTFAGYSDWRLPNIAELQSLPIRFVLPGAPYINHIYFPNTASNLYWSATTFPDDTTEALSAAFQEAGYVIPYPKGLSTINRVRAVRGGG